MLAQDRFAISILRYYIYIENSIDRRIAQRLAGLRAERGWTLQTLASRTGISRASLSRIERSELSPTASMLTSLCRQYGLPLSRLMAEAENEPPSVVRADQQVAWKDPASSYVRRIVSPPHPHLKGEMVEVTLPAGASVSYDVSPLPGLEHHLWMLEGTLDLEIEGTSRFVCGGKRPARYIISFVHP